MGTDPFVAELRVVLAHNASSPESPWASLVGSTAPAINLPVATGAVNR